jgi:hypothetical protein
MSSASGRLLTAGSTSLQQYNLHIFRPIFLYIVCTMYPGRQQQEKKSHNITVSIVNVLTKQESL